MIREAFMLDWGKIVASKNCYSRSVGFLRHFYIFPDGLSQNINDSVALLETTAEMGTVEHLSFYVVIFCAF